MSIDIDYNIGEDLAYVDGERYMREQTTAVYETEVVKCTRDYPTLYHGKFVSGLPLTVHVMKCSECGRTYEHVSGGYEFCPRCGRRIVEVGA